MAGPELLYGEPDSTSPDPGLFGPESMTWRVHGDPSGLVGGVRALLLQALHPEAMAGVAAHSDFREDPWGRLVRTAEYIAVTSFGTTTEAEAAGARVRMVHRRLGVDRPDLLLWVHAGFVDSLLSSYTRTVGLSPAQADAYVLEQREAARLIGLDPTDVFGSVSDLKDYMRRTRSVLAITPAAMEAARFVVVPPMDARVRWFTPAQGLWATLAATAFASMPAWARRMYGQGAGPFAALVSPALGGLPVVSDLQATVAVKVWRRTLLALPENIRKGPHIKAAEERLGLDVT
jgi:uncharacterized protein (DUF2236 family)